MTFVQQLLSANAVAFATQDNSDLRLPKTKGNERVYYVKKKTATKYTVRDKKTGEKCEITFCNCLKNSFIK